MMLAIYWTRDKHWALAWLAAVASYALYEVLARVWRAWLVS